MLVLLIVLPMGCAREENKKDAWLAAAKLDVDETEQELYDRALKEDILIVYTVTTRATKVKEEFEERYPGLSVEIRDLRSPDLVEAVKMHYEKSDGGCDVVICNDNSGNFQSELIDTEIVVPYLPASFREKMKEGCADQTITFLNEAEMLFYNSEVYKECPISNIWELTDEKYAKKLYIPNPLRSFSTYAFLCGLQEYEEELLEAYHSYYGKSPELSVNQTVYELFCEKISQNAVFTNSSDEVCEMLGCEGGQAEFGIMVSSKLRMTEYGYHFKPVYTLEPFSGGRLSFSVMLAYGSPNVNTAKLFIRFLLGDEDGQGEGYQPFVTAGTWSARKDVKDGNDVSMEEADFLNPDQQRLIDNRTYFETLWSEILKK